MQKTLSEQDVMKDHDDQLDENVITISTTTATPFPSPSFNNTTGDGTLAESQQQQTTDDSSEDDSDDFYEDMYNYESLADVLDEEEELVKVWKRIQNVFKHRKDALMDRVQNLSSNIKKQVDDRKLELKKRKEKLERELRRPETIKFKDKLAFTLGVIILTSSTFLLAKYPQFLPNYYMILCVIFMVVRFFSYHGRGYHYFMLDFCYLANLILIFYLTLYPTSPHLFMMNFVNCTGPLLFAVIMWRNSLVFHSIEKVTSVFIHIYPNLVIFVLRWMVKHEDGIVKFPITRQEYHICNDEKCTISFRDVFYTHIVLFCFWQIGYTIKTNVIDKSYLQRREHLQTTYRYLTSKSYIQILSDKIYGPKYRPYGFITLQFIYHMLTLIPVKFAFDNFYLHALMLSGVFLCSIYNGASFYFERFVQHYVEDLNKIADKLEKEEREAEALERLTQQSNAEQHVKCGSIETPQESRNMVSNIVQ
ncbi:hypothetical protein C9374_007476 [Naegleria lovaniensis]|uniref:Glycerophosphocholine acyltransferase 1 n=1 Tax=Naegleria lovaniensis TaxID=51637 RepID=A0AA88GL04_NAELO|nr:uncharacterized protein C9374_007476 [Naegleria lovaniensis]KAG2379337.1 hypothetical protein C9374_007476 [Naegleria lovaniensis]